METQRVGRFLAGIGAVIWSPTRGAYLLLRRSAQKDFAAGAWECVTGRVDQGEGFEDALRREVMEELGLAVFVDFIIGTTHFYRGAALVENELLGVVYHCTLEGDPEIVIGIEHDAYRWVTPDEIAEMVSQDVPSEAWLVGVLQRADVLRAHLATEVLALHRAHGFELG
jgi:8-oxo-dGTP diphosphatase